MECSLAKVSTGISRILASIWTDKGFEMIDY